MGYAEDPETGGRVPEPWELSEMVLCKLYGCTPSQLDQEDHERVQKHLIILDVMEELKALKA